MTFEDKRDISHQRYVGAHGKHRAEPRRYALPIIEFVAEQADRVKERAAKARNYRQAEHEIYPAVGG